MIKQESCHHPQSDADKCQHPDCKVCKICHGSGWNHGAQNWSEKFIRKHGSPYYSVRCGCGA